MANSSYQIATTPKLYVSYPLFQYASGALDVYSNSDGNNNSFLNDEEMIKLIQIDPSNQIQINSNSTYAYLQYRILPSNWTIDDGTDLANFIASNIANFDYYMILGHNLHTSNVSVETKAITALSGAALNSLDQTDNINGVNSVPEYDGWSLMNIGNNSPNSPMGSFRLQFDGDNPTECKIGSVLWGKSYQFPVNTQLSTSTKFEYGIKQKSTISGKTISSANWTKPNNWGTEPFGLTEGEEVDNFTRRSGRRVWKMSFDSLAPDKVMPQNMMMNSNGYTAQDNHTLDANDSSLYNINNSEDFYSAVVHKTMGGHLPMVLQIDSSDNSPSNFAIVRMNKDYTVTQKSPLLFSYSITLTEQI